MSLSPHYVARCAYCGEQIPNPGRYVYIHCTAYLFGRLSCTECATTPPDSLEFIRISRWLTMAKTVQRQGLLQKVLSGESGYRIGYCLHPLWPTCTIRRTFLSPPLRADGPFRGLGTALPNIRNIGVLLNARAPEIHPTWLEALRCGAPQIHLGDYVRTRVAPTKTVGRAYTAPPDVRHRTLELRGGGAHIVTIAPGTYLGPIEDFAISGRFLSILVRGYWVNIWIRPMHGERGATIACKAPAWEVEEWRANGWQD